jgi:hypothetical protein
MAEARQWPQARLQLRVTSQATNRSVPGKIREFFPLIFLSSPIFCHSRFRGNDNE